MGQDPDKPRRTVPTKCASCDRPLDSPLFCSSCRRLYPADGLGLFELLGVEPAYDIDAGEVRSQYFRLARAIHPDRVSAGAMEQERLSMRVAAQINQAFRVLLDPVLRAEYLLELAGGKAAVDDKHVSPEVLAETLELREAIEEAKAAGNQGALAGLRREIQSRFDATLEEIGTLARALPGSDETRRALRGKLNAIRYYRKMFERLEDSATR